MYKTFQSSMKGCLFCVNMTLWGFHLSNILRKLGIYLFSLQPSNISPDSPIYQKSFYICIQSSAQKSYLNAWCFAKSSFNLSFFIYTIFFYSDQIHGEKWYIFKLIFFVYLHVLYTFVKIKLRNTCCLPCMTLDFVSC